MTSPMRLGRTEIAVNHLFTHPNQIEPDRAVLQGMIADLPDLFASLPEDIRFPYHRALSEQMWRERLIITCAPQILAVRSLYVVGFFGQRRVAIAQTLEDEIKAMDRQLVDNFSSFPPVMCYYTRHLTAEQNYVNLVLLDQEEGIQAWRTILPHPYAASTLSPRYYRNVRIYNGFLPPDSLGRSQRLQLQTVKYWDYEHTPTWHALRSL